MTGDGAERGALALTGCGMVQLALRKEMAIAMCESASERFEP